MTRIRQDQGESIPAADRQGLATLPHYAGFPYLLTRVVPALYHIALLPVDVPQSALMRLVERQVDANRLDTCLTLASDRALFFCADGRMTSSTIPPRGGTLLVNRLRLAVDFPATPDLQRREADLVRIVENRRQKGACILGDLAKGGRKATPNELESMAGRSDDGTPAGLARCAICGDWRGECLDPSPEFDGMVMAVHCRCDNRNRCARCGRTLYERRLNANFYDPHDGGIWHVPGFCGLSHRC